MLKELIRMMYFRILDRRFVRYATKAVEAATQISEIEPVIKMMETYIAHGDKMMQCFLGCIYGRMDKDWYNPAKSAEYLEPLAEEGMVEAQFNMAMMCYAGGPGFAEDAIMGYHWMRKAADQEHPLALEFLRLREEGFCSPSRYIP